MKVKRSTIGKIKFLDAVRPESVLRWVLFFSLLVLPMLTSCGTALSEDQPQADNTDSLPPTLTQPNSGLVMPWITYEAEDGTGGAVIGPSTAYLTVAAEASGRRYANLESTGASVSWTATARANSIVVRYTIPDTMQAPSDAENGNVGTLVPLEVLVNGVVVATVELTSSTSWVYGGFRWDAAGTWERDRWSNEPSGGSAHHFFDEANALLGAEIAVGDTVAVRKADDSSAYIGIDFIDLEFVGDPLPQPAGSLSLADYAPAGDGVTDDTEKLKACIAAAKAAGKAVWVPAGCYRIGSIDVSNVTIRGAGMWHTRFAGKYARFNCVGGNLGFYDFAVFGDTSIRDDASGAENAFNGNPGSGSTIERVWVERKKCAFWVGEWNNSVAASGLAIRDCRFRDLMADAVNLCNGTSNSVISGCSVRNAGDDALAVWSPASGGPLAHDNVISGNEIRNPWFANGIALYGGKDLTVENNDVYDTLTTASGIFISAHFGARPFEGTIAARGNRVIRCGSNESDAGGQAGAVRLLAWDANMTGAAFEVTDTDVTDSVCQGISFQTNSAWSLSGVRLADIRVSGSGTWGLEERSGARGSASIGAVSVSGSVSGAYRDGSALFAVTDLGNNEGWKP